MVAGIESEKLNESIIREQLAKELAKFKVPKRVIFVDSLLRNTMGKIQKKVMREQYQDLYKS